VEDTSGLLRIVVAGPMACPAGAGLRLSQLPQTCRWCSTQTVCLICESTPRETAFAMVLRPLDYCVETQTARVDMLGGSGGSFP